MTACAGPWVDLTRGRADSYHGGVVRLSPDAVSIARIAAHDLAGNVHGMLTFLELAEAQVTDPALARYLDRIRTCARACEVMTRSLRALAEPRPVAGFDLRRTCERVLAAAAGPWRSRLGDATCGALGDERLAEIAIEGFSRRAARDSGAEGCALALERDGAHATLTVDGSGTPPPVAAGERPVDPMLDDRPGLPRGLDILAAHLLAAASGGAFGVDRGALGGARFVLRLPLAAEVRG